MNLIKSLVVVVALLAVSQSPLSQSAFAGEQCCSKCGEKVCVAQPVTKKVEKHCYKIETKDICIPKFRWPWQSCKQDSCCDSECTDGNCYRPKCGKVKTVKTFKKEKYECKKCGYEWKIYTVDRCSSCNH